MQADLLERTRQEMRGLDNLELVERGPLLHRRLWSTTWPKIAAFLLTILLWQLVVWSHWRPTYLLPPPLTVGQEVMHQLGTSKFRDALVVTGTRAVTGFALALVAGTFIGLLVARFSLLRKATGSLITGLQTMPSIAWFPLAILLFKLSESAILFVVVLGAAPSIANGLIGGVDHIPPLLTRAGRALGANNLQLYRYVIFPAALPSYVSGLKQGWAFGWRSLMAGELLVIVSNHSSVGVQLAYARELSDAPALVAMMVVILAIGIVVDAGFGAVDRRIRARRGLEGAVD